MRIGLAEGVLFRSGEALHKARGITLFAFDKTGTLSQGSFQVRQQQQSWPGAESIVASLTRDNGHPIAKSVAALTASAVPLALEDVVSVPGKGIQATYQGFPVRGGSAQFCGFSDDESVQKYVDAGLSVFVVAIGHRLIAAYGLTDAPRPEAHSLLAALRARGHKVALVSGDNQGSVERFAIEVDLPPADTHAACSPKAKADIVEEYRRNGHSVCFVGDGTNDSIAFAAADVSLSLVSGSEIAVASADVLLLGSDICQSVLKAMAVAEMTYRHSILGLAWCSLYAVAAILLASGALVTFHIEPRWAGLGEVVSVVPVVAIAFAMFLSWRYLGRAH